MRDGSEEGDLAEKALGTAEARAVYADWLLERGDPRGAVLLAADALALASGATAKDRADARLELVAALKRLAGWLDERVPEGRPWRPADVRGVTSEQLGFVSHERGLLRRLRVAPGRETPLPLSLGAALPTVEELGLPAAPPASARLGAEAVHPVRLLDLLGPEWLARVACLDVELPGALPRLGARGPEDAGWRFRGLGAALRDRSRPLQLRLADGGFEVGSLSALLAELPASAMVWLDRVRLPPDTAGDVSRRAGVVPHLRLTETPVALRVARGLAGAGAFEGLERLELKDWPVGAPALEVMLRGAARLRHLGVIRSPLGPELARLLVETDRLARLDTLDVSGCLLGAAGAARLLEAAPDALERLVLRFNQLTGRDVESFAQLRRWPRAEVRFEEVTFGPEAHQALAAVAASHGLRLEVSGCVFSLRPSPSIPAPPGSPRP
ncbi:MAG: hypothetical protein INH41_26425 [Myxococcaceae bacterium]|nr:hypothetical protein [Myxococcaceae bacterium]